MISCANVEDLLEDGAADLRRDREGDGDFHLFIERSTGQDSVIYRTPGGYRLALADPNLSRPGPLPGSVTVSPLPASRLTVQEATGRLDATGQPFTFFVDARTGRGSLVYHRYNGHYGLLVPAGVRCDQVRAGGGQHIDPAERLGDDAGGQVLA
jgi:Sigma 54 modulation/S30EA ribosomal protein C terminus